MCSFGLSSGADFQLLGFFSKAIGDQLIRIFVDLNLFAEKLTKWWVCLVVFGLNIVKADAAKRFW